MIAPDTSLVRRGQRLAELTIAWNTIEGVVALVSGWTAGSIALLGFGADSFVEITAGVIVLWRLRDREHEASAAADRRAVRLISISFFALAVAVVVESAHELLTRQRPDPSALGIAITIASLVIMPLLASRKRRVGRALGSRAVAADAAETQLCVWLSAVVLGGLIFNATLGWWWMDPLAALGVALIAAREGRTYSRQEALDNCC